MIYIQGSRDMAHPRPDLDRFVAQYRKIGGQVDLELIEGEAEGFISKKPAAARADDRADHRVRPQAAR